MQISLRPALVALVAATALVTASCSSTDAPETTSTSVTSGNVDAATGVALIGKDSSTVIDVRTPQEYAAGHVAGAENIDVTAADFQSRVEALPRDGQYVLYCHSGNRAAAAAEAMKQMGFTKVVNAGGFDALASAGADVE